MLKAFARLLLFLAGWKVNRNVPIEAKRSVTIAAPHTSNWDAYFLRLAFWVLDIPLKVAIKNDWTRFPFGLIVKTLGGVGIDRGPKEGYDRLSQVEIMANLFSKFDEISLVIAPEGTRKKRDRWKLGFYWIAKKANVPITLGYLDYKNKIAGIGPEAIYLTEDSEADIKKVVNFYRDIQGRNPELFQLDERYL